ncbi:MAG: IPT/TIG domain-containing protein [Bryobacteraceae bacterium]
MRVSFVVSVLLAVFLLSSCLSAQSAMPQMKSVDPDNGKIGDLLTVTGENLERAIVAKLYLTDGTNDVEVAMTTQEATTITFKIPAKAKPGRLALMVLTRGKEPKLIEQPVKVTVEE